MKCFNLLIQKDFLKLYCQSRADFVPFEQDFARYRQAVATYDVEQGGFT